MLAGDFVFLQNDQIVAEYIDVLNREKFNFNKEEVSRLIEYIKCAGVALQPCRLNASFPDPDDRVFYEVALAEPNARLVTGNLKHYPISPIVVTPAQFCELLGV